MIDELGIGGFVLKQDDDFLKLGTDAMLLSDFARISKAGTRVCDLGCGNGAISILIAARHAQAHIDAIEIMPGAARLAHENVELNGLSSRMRVLCGDIKDVRKHYATESFDCVVANPPYLAS
ncbi:MAG: methyltransferase, partial [Clostridia bacterium]